MKDKIFGVLAAQSGRSFMLPIAILPVAGLPARNRKLIYQRDHD